MSFDGHFFEKQKSGNKKVKNPLEKKKARRLHTVEPPRVTMRCIYILKPEDGSSMLRLRLLLLRRQEPLRPLLCFFSMEKLSSKRRRPCVSGRENRALNTNRNKMEQAKTSSSNFSHGKKQLAASRFLLNS